MTFLNELEWRNMIHDIMPGTKEKLSEGMATGYIGYDPTAPSLHTGNLAAIMMLVHFQRFGHKPIALVGGATGMIGDPSGREEERVLLSKEVLAYNQQKIKEQLEKFLDFKDLKNSAEIVNNFDWFKDIDFLSFLREAGKHLTVNYMLAKDSVKQRLEKGLSFTEFSYQLLQAYDFYWLYKNKNCVLQMGGSDQWGNITSGTELIRRKAQGNAFALTCPLVTRSDGSKFGKSEGQNIWLSAGMTSPYKFYQYWLNCSDEDSQHFIKIFTLFSRREIDHLISQHEKAPHQRILQKALARDITIRVHSKQDFTAASQASEILFGKGEEDSLKKLSKEQLLSVFEGVPQKSVSKSALSRGITILDLMVDNTGIFPSRGEARRMIKSGGVSVNRKKIAADSEVISSRHFLHGDFVLLQKGKKNYFLLKAE